jgi:hypothetical protein
MAMKGCCWDAVAEPFRLSVTVIVSLWARAATGNPRARTSRALIDRCAI